MIIIAILVVRTKTATRSLEVVAIVASTSAGTFEGVLVVQIKVVWEGVVSRTRRRPLFLARFLLEIEEDHDAIEFVVEFAGISPEVELNLRYRVRANGTILPRLSFQG